MPATARRNRWRKAFATTAVALRDSVIPAKAGIHFRSCRIISGPSFSTQ
jgi:hypothetical protein